MDDSRVPDSDNCPLPEFHMFQTVWNREQDHKFRHLNGIYNFTQLSDYMIELCQGVCIHPVKKQDNVG